MTTVQMSLTSGFYLAVFVALAYLTRANLRRIGGALAGGSIFAVVALLAIALGEARGWWRVPRTGSPHFRPVLWLAFAVSSAPIYLITWRVARRFGGRGLAVCVLTSAIIGPPRDYLVAATFPGWMSFSPGVVPGLADAAIYALLVVVGHAVMRMAAGPALKDPLTTRFSSG